MKDAIAVPSERSDWKPLKLLDLEFANSISAPEGTPTIRGELSMKRLTITRREQASGHIVVMIEIKGRIRYGYGKRKIKGFRPYDQSRGGYLGRRERF